MSFFFFLLFLLFLPFFFLLPSQAPFLFSFFSLPPDLTLWFSFLFFSSNIDTMISFSFSLLFYLPLPTFLCLLIIFSLLFSFEVIDFHLLWSHKSPSDFIEPWSMVDDFSEGSIGFDIGGWIWFWFHWIWIGGGWFEWVGLNWWWLIQAAQFELVEDGLSDWLWQLSVVIWWWQF